MKYLPKWEMRGYAKLWSRFKTRGFNHEQAVKALGVKKEMVSIILSDLKKAGWLKVSLDEKDTRKRLYNLVDSKKSWNELLKELARK